MTQKGTKIQVVNQEIVWQSLSWPSAVLHKHVVKDDEIIGHGLAVGKTDQDISFAYEYVIALTLNWDIKSLRISSLLDERVIALKYKAGKWYDNNNSHLDAFDGIHFFDLSFSPFTNSLPIKQLEFNNDEPQRVKMLYFDENNFSLKIVEQLYSRIDERVYKYQDVELTDFTANIMVDENGLVTDFEKLFKRV